MTTRHDDETLAPRRLWPTAADITARVQACGQKIRAGLRGIPHAHTGLMQCVVSVNIDPIPDRHDLLAACRVLIETIRQSRPSDTARLRSFPLWRPKGIRSTAIIRTPPLILRYVCDYNIRQDRLQARLDCAYAWIDPSSEAQP